MSDEHRMRERMESALALIDKQQRRIEALERAAAEPIAIVGAACRFPGGASTPEAFWRLLRDGVDAVTEVPADRWDTDAYYDPDPAAPGKMYTRHGSFLERIDEFDPKFFGIAPREASGMDPQQRLLLEVAWEALENAGHPPHALRGSNTGVYVGSMANEYAAQVALRDPSQIDAYTATGAAGCFLAGRLSYQLDLQGPSLPVDTACSSSLVAIHLACESLRSRRCDLALAGGVNVILSPEMTIVVCRLQALSPTGRCKTFDAAADGFVRGEGCGLVVLKRLSDALAANDEVLAVLRGTAVNHDGQGGGIKVPSAQAQQQVIREALARGGVDPREVSYVEAHGTGTPLGDPIELRALWSVLGKGRSPEQRLTVGSVKTNVGHLEGAAGIAGLLKVVLSLQHEHIPPHLHLKTLNPHIAGEGFPIEIPRVGLPWAAGDRPRLAGVSSFGISGTNAHVVVAEAPRRKPQAAARPASGAPAAASGPGPEPAAPARREGHVLALSARTAPALRELAARFAAWIEQHPDAAPADVCFTAGAGRTHFEERAALVVESLDQAKRELASFAEGSRSAVASGHAGAAPRVAFLFTGQGSQYTGMARELYETQPEVRRTLDRADELLRGKLDRPLLEVLFSPGAPLEQTAYTQPALFAVEVALANLWRSLGVTPDVVLGHSVGEYAAACVASVLGFEDGLALIAERGRLMQSLPAGGSMAAIKAGAARVEGALASSPELSIAAYNGANTVVSGRAEALSELLARLAADGIEARRLETSHAFHSALLDPVLPELEAFARRFELKTAALPLISNLTGRALAPDERIDARYFRLHAREPVQFGRSVETLAARGVDVLVEIGPDPVLLGMARRAWPEGRPVPLSLPSLRRGKREALMLSDAIARLYARGLLPDLAGLDRAAPRRKLALPTYPFQRQRYWVEAPSAARRGAYPPPDAPPAGPQATPEGAAEPRRGEVVWRDHPRRGQIVAASFLMDPEPLAAEVDPMAAGIVAEEGAAFYPALIPELDALAVAYTCRAFAALGWSLSAGDEAADPVARLGLDPRLGRFVHRLLEILIEAGLVERRGAVWRVLRAPDDIDPAARSAALLAQTPAARIELTLLDRIGARLAEGLRGTLDPLALLFPKDGSIGAEQLYGDAPGALVTNRVLAQALVAAIAAMPPGRTLRVLEIGAGTGGTTRHVLPALASLPPGRLDYTFTDVSSAFFAAAEARFSAHPFLSYRTLDVGRDPELQGFEPHRHDIVIAANAIHAGANLPASVEHAKKLLAPGGLLVLMEGIRRQAWIDVTFGLLGSWWAFADELRADHPLLTWAQWAALLGDKGFHQPTALAHGILGSNQAILLARAPAEGVSAPSPVRSPGEGAWLLLADKGGLTARLGERLRDLGRAVVSAAPGIGPAALEEALSSVLEGGAPLEGVVVAAGLDAAASTEAEAAPAIVARTADDALDLTRVLARRALSPSSGLWLLTRGAQPALPGELPAPAQAPLTALGAALAKEHAGLRCRSVDLDPRGGAEEIEGLLGEILAPGDEDRIALRPGVRLVPRQALAPTPKARGRRAADPSDRALLARLQIAVPGRREEILTGCVQEETAEVLRLPPGDLPSPDQGFFDMGMDSLMAVEVRDRLQSRLGLLKPLSSTALFDHPTIAALVRHLSLLLVPPGGGERPATAAPRLARRTFAAEPIAVVGLACRFPGAPDAGAFWRLLRDGVDAVREVPEDRWDIDAYYDPDPDAPGKMYTRHGAFLAEVDRFDPQFFGIAPREAVSMDPQQRLLLEVSWEALEHAGIAPDRLAGSRTGVYVGICNSDYRSLIGNHGIPLDAHMGSGTSHSIAAGRVSYVLGLSGPSLAIDTACSSSLVAVHQARQSLLTGESDLALAGGVNLMLAPEVTIGECRARMLSPGGRCKTFDAAADGFVRGEGCGIVVLKRLSDAERDGDRILAIIPGSAINQDGASSGLTVPNGTAQERLLRDALAAAGLEPEAMHYVEAHGTGTSLGDPIEVRALAAVMAEGRTRDNPLLIGSVKTNVGHMETAAGIAGLIKVVLALAHEELPPHLHLRSPNPHIPWDDIAVEVTTELRTWPAARGQRLAGVSAFGFSGTNAHILLADPPAPADGAAEPPPAPRAQHVLALSARTEPALRELAGRHAAWLDAHEGASLADLCFTANAGRAHFEHRAAAPVASIADARLWLDAVAQKRGAGAGAAPVRGRARVAFLFSGEGSLQRRAARELYAVEPAFRRELDRLAGGPLPGLDRPPLELLFDEAPPIEPPALAAPLLFAVEVALAALWQSFGVTPDVVFGSGVGEIAAACVAGVLEPEDGMRLALEHGRFAQADPGEPRLARFEALARELSYRPAKVPLISSLRGAPLDAADLLDAAYWLRQLSEPARLPESLAALDESGAGVWLELGPASSRLDTAHAAAPRRSSPPARLACLGRTPADTDPFAEVVSALYTSGVTPDFAAMDGGRGHRKLDLPTYPFQRERYWIVPAAKAEKAPAVDEITPLLHQVTWRPRPAAPSHADERGAWLILADEGGIGASLAAILEARGRHVTLIHERDVDIDQPGAFDALLTAADPLARVVHLFSLDVPGTSSLESLARAERSSLTSALHLTQALLRGPGRGRRTPRLWLVTRGAQAVLDSDDPAAAQAPLWGFGKVAALEHPELWGGLVDLPAGADPSVADALLGALHAGDGEDQIALREGQRWVSRLVAAGPPRSSGASAGRLRSDASYLVTGGLGGLGWRVARCLIERGAGHVVLTGRRAPDGEGRERLAVLQGLGAEVRFLRADAADRVEVAALLATLEASAPPLRGIVHAAGVLDDGVLVNQSRARLAGVLAPKVHGALHLHELTRERPLDFFVLFSSAASVFGSPGQSSYAAANAFLDALAAHRRARGLPALSINWGPWGESGMAADLAQHDRQRWQALGVEPLAPALALRALEALLPGDQAGICVLKVRWSAAAALTSRGHAPPLLAELLGPGSPSAAPAEPTLVEQLRGEHPSQRRAKLRDHVHRTVARVLDLDVARIDDHTGFFDFGLDSLMALDLRRKLQHDLGEAHTLSSTVVLDHPTVERLTEHLSRLVLDPPGPRKDPRAAPPEARRAEPALDGLSADELDSLLDAELADEH